MRPVTGTWAIAFPGQGGEWQAAIEVLRTSNAGRNGLEDQVVRRLGEIVADRLKRRPVIVAQVFLTEAA